MKKAFIFEWKRMMHSPSLWFSLIAAGLIIIGDVLQWFLMYLRGVDVSTGVFYKWLGINRGMHIGIYFFLALPLLTAMAYSWTVSHDRNTGYAAQVINRVGRRKYFAAKFLVTFLSGGIVFAGALILDFMLLATFSPAYRPWPGDLASAMDPFHFCSELFYRNPYVFCLLWCGVAFLWGGTMSCMGAAAGMLTKKRVLSGIMPFLLFTAQPVAVAFILQHYRITIYGHSVNLTWTEMLNAGNMLPTLPEHILATIGVLLGISTLIYVLRGWKYECL